jgi:tetratricopeptide (TPR) repeat protein
MRLMRDQSTRRPAALHAITLLVPLLVLGLTELVLRLFDVGALEPLFTSVPSVPGYRRPNPQAIERFFNDPRAAPRVAIDTTYFPAIKTPNTFRVFVVGESSAAGFPYGRWASPGAFLAQRLGRSLPDREIEVISTAMSAVTTQVLLDFVDEILAEQPDAIVIYTGHNEYLGIGGVGSSFVAARSPALARLTSQLRRFHVYHALERAIGRLAPAAPTRSEGTLMARAAREQRIAYGSELYARGLEQFRDNLDRIVERFVSAGVPVLLGTLASNERDRPPFDNVLAETTDAARWGAEHAAATAALEQGDATGAERLLRSLVTADPGAAAAHFSLARALEAQGRNAEARRAYLAAKDRDGLRFRAPEASNDVIREVARARGARLIDVQQALAAASESGIIGRELMLEHLHPNVEGYFRIADAFYAPLLELAGGDESIDPETAWTERPTTEIDRLAGEYRIAVLINDWPFVPQRRQVELAAPRDEVERIAQVWFADRIGWPTAMTQALEVYQSRGDLTEAARVAVNLAEAFPYADNPQWIAGRLLIRADASARALRYLSRATALAPDNIDYGLSLAEALFHSGRTEAAQRTLEALVGRAPDDERPRHWLEVVRAQSR